jgi:predicted  nucleic acid-binding Zn-ribbon protein
VDQLKPLIVLQKAFGRNCETGRGITELEQTLERMEASVQLAEAMKRMEGLDQEIHDLKAAIRQKYVDVEAAKEREADRQALLEGAGSPRELQALETQLKAAQKYREATESESLELEERLDGLTKQHKALLEQLPRLREAADQERRSAEERLESLCRDRENLLREMETLRAVIAPSVLREFDRLINCRGGMAVVPLVGDSRCGGCGLALPMLVVEEISDNELVQCECCSRFIVREQVFEDSAVSP